MFEHVCCEVLAKEDLCTKTGVHREFTKNILKNLHLSCRQCNDYNKGMVCALFWF